MARRTSLAALAALLVVVSTAAPAGAVSEASNPIEKHALGLASGPRPNPSPQVAVVYSETIDLGDANWVRLRFADVSLEAGSFLRITSISDGETQTLDAKALAAWGSASAYFNGPAVEVELVATPGTTRNWVSITQAITDGSPYTSFGTRRVCVVADNRLPSNNAATARLLSSEGATCTGFITDRIANNDQNNRCMLSAGHCFEDDDPSIVAEFNVPASKANCGVNHPPVNSQFPVVGVVDFVAAEGMRNLNGDDWAAFVCGKNNLGQTVIQAQGAQFALAAPAAGAVVKFGYGTAGDPVGADGDDINCECRGGDVKAPLNKTQQSSAGNLAVAGNAVNHSTHTCPADSGAPIVNTAGAAVAIQTHGGCAGGAPDNSGTSIQKARLQAALADCVPPPNHFECYELRPEPFAGRPVDLVDQFGSVSGALLQRPERLCAPADKNDEQPVAPFQPDHLTGYRIRYPFVPLLNQRVTNQFGSILVDVLRPDRLLVPSAKSFTGVPPVPTDPAVGHFQCYKIRRSRETPRFVFIPGVKVDDQFGTVTVTVARPIRLCVPVDKNHEEPGAETRSERLLCYRTSRTSFPQAQVFLNDQFGPMSKRVIRREELCVPSL